MANARKDAVLLLVGLWLITFNNIVDCQPGGSNVGAGGNSGNGNDKGTNGNGKNNTGNDNNKDGNGQLRILGTNDTVTTQIAGRSGQMKVTSASGDKLTILFDSMKEVTSGGDAISAHSINSFARTDFAFSDVQQIDFHGIQALSLNFSSYLQFVGAQLLVQILIFQEEGTLEIAGEETNVTASSIKFNIQIDSWNFAVNGANIDFVITITTSKSARSEKMSDRKPGEQNRYKMSPGVELLLSKKVKVDGKWEDIGQGYPINEYKGNKNLFTFRFPRFNSSIFYDPTIQFENSKTKNGSTGDSNGDGGNSNGGNSNNGTDVDGKDKVTGGGKNSTGNGTDTDDQEGVVTAGDVTANISKSGVMSLSNGTKSVNIGMSSLSMLDINGNPVGGDVGSFSDADFTITQTQGQPYGIDASVFNISTSIFNGVRVDLVSTVFKGEGNFSVGGVPVEVAVGTVKADIHLDSSTYQLPGAQFMDVEMNVGAINPYAVVEKIYSGDTEDHYLIDNDVTLYISKMVRIDGIWEKMAEGYPKYNNGQLLLRLRRFQTDSYYDPVIYLHKIRASSTRYNSGGSGGSGDGSQSYPGNTGSSLIIYKGGSNMQRCLFLAFIQLIVFVMGYLMHVTF